jgi:hypothetical protein
MSKKKETRLTNKEFSKQDDGFKKACAKVRELSGKSDFEGSTRQASKYRRNAGIAWKATHEKTKQ